MASRTRRRADKLYDNLDFQRAVQAYLFAIPVVSQVGEPQCDPYLGAGQHRPCPIFEQLLDSRSVFLTANDNTVYSWTWLDLGKGPLVVEVPPKVLGGVNDMWYRWVIDVGITGPDKGEGGKYLFLPPGYKGDVPQGYNVVQSPTFSLWMPWRSFLVNGDPKPGVDLVKNFTRIYPLADADKAPPTLNFVDMSGKPFNTVAPADYSFWELLNQVVQEEPTDSLDQVRLGFYRAIGIQKGKPFAPDERMKKILTEASAVGDATARAILFHTAGEGSLLLRQRHLAASVRRRLQVPDRARSAESRRLRFLLLRGNGRHTGDGNEDGRRRLANTHGPVATPTGSRSTAARTTGCICRPTSRSRTSGR